MPDNGERCPCTGRKLRPQCEECKDEDRVAYGRNVQAVVAQSESARNASAHRDAHAAAGNATADAASDAQASGMPSAQAMAAAQARAQAHLAAARRAEQVRAAVNAPVPLQRELQLDQAELAKRRKPRRGYALDPSAGWWYEGDITEAVGTGSFKAKYDSHDPSSESGIPPERIVKDGDKLFVTWDRAVDYMEVRTFSLHSFLCSFAPNQRPRPRLLAGEHRRGGGGCARRGGAPHGEPQPAGRHLAERQPRPQPEPPAALRLFNTANGVGALRGRADGAVGRDGGGLMRQHELGQVGNFGDFGSSPPPIFYWAGPKII